MREHQQHKRILIFFGLAAATLLGACAETRQASVAPLPPTHVAYEASPEAMRYAMNAPEDLNDIEAASGVASQLAMLEPQAGEQVADLEQVAALQGCDYKQRLSESDRLGYRWGSESNNRLGLNFGGSNTGSGSRGVRFGYTYTFEAPSKHKAGC